MTKTKTRSFRFDLVFSAALAHLAAAAHHAHRRQRVAGAHRTGPWSADITTLHRARAGTPKKYMPNDCDNANAAARRRGEGRIKGSRMATPDRDRAGPIGTPDRVGTPNRS